MNGHFQIGALSPARYFLTIAVVVGLLFFFIAPDNDSKDRYVLGALQWQLQTVIPMFLAVGLHILLSRISQINRLSVWVKLLISGFMAAMVFTPLALFIDLTIGDESLRMTVLDATLNEFFATAPPIVICWVAINLPFQLGYQLSRNEAPSRSVSREHSGYTERTDERVEPGHGFIGLLLSPVVGEIIYLKSELHYLKVVTTEGESLVLYSLRDAIAELHHYDGFQPHRSFWVNRNHVESAKKTGREGRLSMSNGQSIPVSRNQMKTLDIK